MKEGFTPIAGKRILVTGAGGFIGSHLVERLWEKGACVRAMVHYNSANRWGWLEALSGDVLNKIEVVSGDVRDSSTVRRSLDDIDIVFHLAALISIPYSYHSPEGYVETNIRGTLNILTAARDLNIKRVLITSTSEVYGTAQYVPIDERHPHKGQSPYAATKIGADRLAESFFRSFHLPVTIVRPFNTYGPRQSARAIIPTIITQLLKGREIHLGSLSPTRDFVYVKDTVEGFIKIAEVETTVGEEINIATQQEYSIGEVVQIIAQELKVKPRIITDENRIRPQDSEVLRLMGSQEKLKRLTGWTPSYSLKEGLLETIDWFSEEKNRQFYKVGIYHI